MAKKIDVIEFNGQSYDATTGQKLAGSKRARQVKPVVAHHPKKSETLMRRAVKKPAPVTKVSHPEPLVLADQRWQARLERAQQAPKSQAISHFGGGSQGAPYQPIVVATEKGEALELATEPISLPPEPLSRREIAAHHIDQALRSADSHKQPKHRKRSSHKAIALAGSSLLVVLVAGYLALNQPLVRLKVAEARSAIGANLTHQPAGYSLSSVAYSPGKLSADFSGSQGTYSLSAQKVLWNNSDLVNQFLDGHSLSYQTVDLGSQTIYTYGQSNATWLKNGVWYVLNNQGTLNINQLSSLVSSL